MVQKQILLTTLRVRQSPISAEAKTGAGLTKTLRHQVTDRRSLF
ncbi:hypothetical protein [Fischerella sp.]|nr:hypothetical protein [Fischerella sp.]